MGQNRVSVTYRNLAGWHVFTADDIPGLYVASPDPIKAYNDVARSLEVLALKNDGQECRFSPEITAEQFFASLEAMPDNNTSGGPKVILHAAA